jgi:RNA polymerase sigma-70 factor (ECF subfamily)
MEDDDDRLAERAQRGNAAAREELARRHVPVLRRLVRRYVREDDAEDVAHKAMMRALDKLESFRGDSSFRSWLHRVAINVALNHARDTKRERACEIDEADLITNTLGTQRLVAREAKARLIGLVEALPEKQREAVRLRLFADLSFAEIGEHLGISEDAAKVNFHHALKRLRTELAPTVGIGETNEPAAKPSKSRS